MTEYLTLLDRLDVAVEALREPVANAINDRLSIPETITSSDKFGLNQSLNNFIGTYLSDPYLLTTFFLAKPIQGASFYPISLFKIRPLDGSLLSRSSIDFLKIYQRMLIPHIDFPMGDRAYQAFNPSDIGVESLLLICDAKKKLRDIQIGHIVYACFPFEGKRPGWNYALDYPETIPFRINRVSEIREALNLHNLGELCDRSLEDIPTVQASKHWDAIESLSGYIAEVMNVSSSSELNNPEALGLFRWFSEVIREGAPQESKEMYGCNLIKPDDIQAIITLCKYLTYNTSSLILFPSFDIDIPVPTAKALVSLYLVIDALMINQQFGLIREVVKHLNDKGIVTPKLQSYLDQIKG